MSSRSLRGHMSRRNECAGIGSASMDRDNTT